MQFQVFHRKGNVPPPVEWARWVKNEPGWDPMLTALQDNSPTNQLAVSQVADWITRGLVNSPTATFLKSRTYYNGCYFPSRPDGHLARSYAISRLGSTESNGIGLWPPMCGEVYLWTTDHNLGLY